MIHLLSGGRPGSFSEGPDFFFLTHWEGRKSTRFFDRHMCVLCSGGEGGTWGEGFEGVRSLPSVFIFKEMS